MDYTQMISFMQDKLNDVSIKTSKSQKVFTFRKKSEHTLRVLNWAKKISLDLDIDHDVLYTSVIFHDIGYAESLDKNIHHITGEKICRDYLETNNFDKSFIDKVCFSVLNHPNKSLYLNSPNTPLELILLMEADQLDEFGALSIIWDVIHSCIYDNPSYQNAKKYLEKYSFSQKEVMITKKAKEYYQEKLNLIKAFKDNLENEI